MRILATVCILLIPLGLGAEEFNDTWYDGNAELNGYRLTVSRYGQEREGQAVLIYVTEPFSETERVKADRASEDTFNALKLNLVRDFQTGLYDYNTMVSVFCHDYSMDLKKITFSSAEWCGHVFEEQLVYPSEIKRSTFSYFQGESGRQTLPHEPGGILEDHLFILLRSLREPFLNPGETRDAPFLQSPYPGRLTHQEPKWSSITLSRGSTTETLTVPAGSFVTHRYDIHIDPDRTGTFWIEDAYPHRIIRWRLLPDVEAELTGSLRLPYWQLHDNGHETFLRELGLQ